METLLNFIDGAPVRPQSGEYLEGFEPATGRVVSRIPDSDARDVEAAVEAARAAFPGWSSSSAASRAHVLRKLAGLIEENLEALAHAESVDSGKPIAVARTIDIPRSALNFSFFADAITQYSGESHVSEANVLNYTLRSPIGVVGCISPWNLPLYLFTWKIAPALAAGNTVVAKPSEVTPKTAAMLGELCEKAGMPAGVLNIVHGLGHKVGAAMSAHPEIKVISFTGSTRTGAEIARVAAPMFKKLSLELGGKNATVVFADCDFEMTAAETVRAAFSNQGQICLCGSRILVERPLYEKFREALVARVRGLKQGDPSLEDTQQGAVVSQQHLDKVLGAIDLARQEGGRVLIGGSRAQVSGRCTNGYFIQPTLIEGLSAECETNQEEIFGPVATLIPFDSEEEALKIANSTRYGLAASVFTRDFARAHRVASTLHSGIVWINCWMVRDLRTPFGGMKDSGVGREGGLEALRFFTEAKNVCLKT